MKRKVTIAAVVPSYNSADTIVVCINSILAQTVSVDEIIIVDDGSTDGSVAVIKAYLEAVPGNSKITFIQQKNQGPSAARNNGVQAAASEFIAFLDSDDYWFPSKIKVQKEFLEENSDYDIVATKYKSARYPYHGEVDLKKLLLRNYFFTPCIVIKKELFWACKGFNEGMHFAEDYFLWLNAVGQSKGYLLPADGAANIEGKRPFGENGLSANLAGMHRGVIVCYQNLFKTGRISRIQYLMVLISEEIRYLRRRALAIKKR